MSGFPLSSNYRSAARSSDPSLPFCQSCPLIDLASTNLERHGRHVFGRPIQHCQRPSYRKALSRQIRTGRSAAYEPNSLQKRALTPTLV